MIDTYRSSEALGTLKVPYLPFLHECRAGLAIFFPELGGQAPSRLAAILPSIPGQPGPPALRLALLSSCSWQGLCWLQASYTPSLGLG